MDGCVNHRDMEPGKQQTVSSIHHNLSSIFGFEPAERRPFPFKTKVIWVLNTYVYYYMCIYVLPKLERSRGTPSQMALIQENSGW